jgi:Zn-finger nucleic acid-binding protein
MRIGNAWAHGTSLRFVARRRYALVDAGDAVEAASDGSAPQGTRAMICAACGAPIATAGVFPGAPVECGCGATSIVSSARAAGAQGQGGAYRTPAAHDVACPRCAAALTIEGDDETLACAACRGVFVAHEALASRIERARAAIEPSDTGAVVRRARAGSFERDVRYLPCARCAKAMNRMNFGRHSGILVDVCKLHGTWFDAGELEGVLAFVREGGLLANDAPGDAPSTRGHSPPLSPEAARALSKAESLMRYEALREHPSTDRALEVLEDLVSLLFGSGYRGR